MIQVPQISQMTRIGVSPDVRDPETYAIIGAAMEVHRQLGSAFLEHVYQEAMAIELEHRGIPHQREAELPIYYKGTALRIRYRVDFICFGEVLVELKAIGRITTTEESQIINYLAASRFRRGLLLNFGVPSLQFVRFAGPASRAGSSVQSG